MHVRNSIKICNQDFRCLALHEEVRGILICKLALPRTSREIWQPHISQISCIDSRFSPWERRESKTENSSELMQSLIGSVLYFDTVFINVIFPRNFLWNSFLE
jgi:hypothetical protein